MEGTRKAAPWRRLAAIVAAVVLVAGFVLAIDFSAVWAGSDASYTCPDCGEALTAHTAVEATCTEDGNIAYYTCDNEDCSGSGYYVEYDSLSDYTLDFETGSYPAVDIHGYSYSITCVAASVDGLVAYLVDEDGNEQTISADGDYVVWFDDAQDSMSIYGLMTAYYQIFEVTNTELDENGDETLTVYIDPSRQQDWLAWENAQVYNSLDMGWTTLYCYFDGEADEDGNLGCLFSGTDADGNAVTFYGLSEIPITNMGSWEISSFTPDGLVEISDGVERVAATGHDLSLVEAVEPSCTESGNSAYYECASCGKLFADEEAETETTAAGVYLPATGHSAGEVVVENEVAATCTTDGSYETNTYCTVCGELVSSTTTVVSATGHSWDEGVVTEPTCTEGGYTTYTCTVCGGELEGGVYTGDETAALGHSYDYDEVVWEWSEDCNSATASVSCTVCGEVQTVDAEVAIKTTDNACFSGGSVTYTATASFEDGTEATAQQSFEVPAGDHTIVAVEAVEAGCETSGNSAYYKCTVCGKLFSDAEATTEIALDDVTIAATGHTVGEAVVENEVAATCTTDGSYETNTYCTVCGELVSSETTTVAATGHSYDYSNVTWSWAGDYSSATAIVSCTNEGCTGATSGHSESVEAVVSSTTTEAGCTEAGAITYTATATLGDGSTATDTQAVTIAATGHTAGEAVVENEVAVTCTTAGSYQTNTYCTVCGELLTSVTTTVAATGHSYGEGVVTAPTCTEGGYTTYTCTVCGDSYTDDETEAAGHDYDYDNVTFEWADDYSSATASASCTGCDTSDTVEAEVSYDIASNGTCTATATATFDGASTTVTASKKLGRFLFTDVQDSSKYYFESVYVLYYLGYVNGVGDGTAFGVGQNMTREQVVTILWRMAGEPEASTDAGFSDVKSSKYYAEAVNWAAENDIVAGYSNGEFGVGDAMTFEQMTTIIARYAAGGDAALNKAMTDSQAAKVLAQFADGSKVSSWADNGMAYLVEAGLVTGNARSDGTLALSPSGNVARERAVTVLSRAVEAGIL